MSFLWQLLPFAVVVQLLSHVQLFATPGTTACHASLSITNSRSLLKCMSSQSMMPYNHLILCYPLLLLTSFFLSIRVFSRESALPMWWPIYWNFRFSINFPMNIQGWFPLGLTSWISLQSKGLSNISNTTVWKSQFFGAQPSLWSNSHIHIWLITGNTIALTGQTFVDKVIFLVFNLLFKLVIAFLSRSKQALLLS